MEVGWELYALGRWLNCARSLERGEGGGGREGGGRRERTGWGVAECLALAGLA